MRHLLAVGYDHPSDTQYNAAHVLVGEEEEVPEEVGAVMLPEGQGFVCCQLNGWGCHAARDLCYFNIVGIQKMDWGNRRSTRQQCLLSCGMGNRLARCHLHVRFVTCATSSGPVRDLFLQCFRLRTTLLHSAMKSLSSQLLYNSVEHRIVPCLPHKLQLDVLLAPYRQQCPQFNISPQSSVICHLDYWKYTTMVYIICPHTLSLVSRNQVIQTGWWSCSQARSANPVSLYFDASSLYLLKGLRSQ